MRTFIRIAVTMLGVLFLFLGFMFAQENKPKDAPKDDPKAPVLDPAYRADMLDLLTEILKNDSQRQAIQKQYDAALQNDANYSRLTQENAEKIKKLTELANAKKIKVDGKTWIVNPTTAKYEPEPPQNTAQPVTPPAESPK